MKELYDEIISLEMNEQEWKKVFIARFIEHGFDVDFSILAANASYEAYESEIIDGDYYPIDAAEDEIEAMS